LVVKNKKEKEKKMKLVLITGDEFSKKEIFSTLEEQDLLILSIFDDGCKVIVEVPDSLPDDPDYKNLAILEYWEEVVQELFYPCCLTESEKGVVSVMTLGDYIRSLFYSDGNRGNFYDYFEEVIEFID